jgi:hypothetical protein
MHLPGTTGTLVVAPDSLEDAAHLLRRCSDELTVAASCTATETARAGPLPPQLSGAVHALAVAVRGALLAESGAMRDLAERLHAAAGDYAEVDRLVAASAG